MQRIQINILLNDLRFVLICFVFISLPFSSALNSILIILIALIGIYFFATSKFVLTSFSSIQIFCLLIFTLIVLHGLKDWFIFSQFSSITKYLVLLAGPFCFYQLKVTQKVFDWILSLFSYFIFSVCVIDLIHFIFNFDSLYSSFDVAAKLHPTYFSLFILVSLAYMLRSSYFELSLKGVTTIFIALVFVFSILFLVARSAIVAMFVILVYHAFLDKKATKLALSIALFAIIICVLFFLFSADFNDRMMSSIDLFLSGEKFSSSGFLLRVNIWIAVWKGIILNNLVLGIGLSQSSSFFLIYSYLENDVFLAYRENFNAHNQFLQLALNFGFLSVIFVCGIIREVIVNSLKRRNHFFLTVAIIFIILFITEVILARQKGIVFFIFLFLLFESNFKNEKSLISSM